MTNHGIFASPILNSRVRSTRCFLPHYRKILIIAKVINGQRSMPMRNSIARMIFNRDFLKIMIFLSSKSIFSNMF